MITEQENMMITELTKKGTHLLSRNEVRERYNLYSKSAGFVVPFDDVWKGVLRSRKFKDYRKNIFALEDKMLDTSPEGYGDNDFNPLKHMFGDDLYVREIFMPKGQLLMSRLHKYTHPHFMMKGDLSIMTEDKPVRVKAPYWGMTMSGTKRVAYSHEDTVWITVHSAKEKHPDKIILDITSVDYESLLPEDDADIKAFVELIKEEEICPH
jgi:hypothetical protein